MKLNWSRLPLGLAMAVVVACGTAPVSSSRESAAPTGAASPATVSDSRHTGSESEPQRPLINNRGTKALYRGALASRVGQGADRNEIIAFTREALEIEAKRNSLMEYFVSLRESAGSLGTIHLVNRWILPGVSEQASRSFADSSMATPPLEGMLSLRNRLLLLDVPQELEPVKDSLAAAYASEIDVGIRQGYFDGGDGTLERSRVSPQVTKDNVAAIIEKAEQFRYRSREYNFQMSKAGGHWGQIQLFRQQIYIRWAAILQEQGVDSAKEGFTELTSP